MREHAPSPPAPRCSLGQAGTAEVGEPVTVLHAYLTDDRTAVVCPTPTTFFDEGRHVVGLCKHHSRALSKFISTCLS